MPGTIAFLCTSKLEVDRHRVEALAVALLEMTESGLYCAAGDFHVDPWKAVDQVLTTHAHSDHARAGSRSYLCAADGVGVLRQRLGGSANIAGLAYGQALELRGVRVSFHPAGHVLGSAQIRLEFRGEVWVVSGDYKLAVDPTCRSFEPVPCHTFVTESTFGLPIYRWPTPESVFREVHEWWARNQRAGQTSVLFGYSLGKAQRLLAGLDATQGPIFVHSAVEKLLPAYRAENVSFPTIQSNSPESIRDGVGKAMVIMPPGTDSSKWLETFGEVEVASASGWMLVRGLRRRQGNNHGFVLSDHADWNGLVSAIRSTGAERVLVTHGYTRPLVRWLREQGYDAEELQTQFTGDGIGALDPHDVEQRLAVADLPLGGGADGRALRVISFVTLFEALERTTSSLDKVVAMEAYFRAVPAADGAWALHFLLGNRLKRAVKSGQMREWVSEVSGHPRWLVEDCYAEVGDLAETLALLLPSRSGGTSLSLSQLVEQRLLPLAVATPATQRELLKRTWAELGPSELFLWHKMITGSLRVVVSRGLVIRAMAALANVDESLMAARLAGNWNPTAVEFERILFGEGLPLDTSRPYPFCLASPLDLAFVELGNPESWQVEWKWDGIRAQLIHRASVKMLWSRRDELVSDFYPEVMEAAQRLPLGTVLDGEILAWQGDEVLPFQVLQRRTQCREPGPDVLRQVPVVFLVYDLLELDSRDVRGETLEWRRQALEALMLGFLSSQGPGMGKRVPWVQGELFSAPTTEGSERNPIRLAPLLRVLGWAEVEALHRKAREMRTAGLMLKSRSSVYEVGRQRSVWWKWKVEPFSCDCVLVAAQPGPGRRASLYTNYTFAVWQHGVLLPVAKVDSGLIEAEVGLVDEFVRAHTIGRFGPMRSVKPELVFELAFDGIATSARNKSGFALRFPRITRWRRDKLAPEAGTLEALRRLQTRR